MTTLYLNNGPEAEAGPLFEQALQLYQQIGSKVGQANIYWTLGRYLAQPEAWGEAEPLLAQAVTLGEQIAAGHPVTLQIQAVWEEVRAKVEG